MKKTATQLKNRFELTIGWLYPELMNTYGDRGNIIVLQKRCEWRNIEVKIERISIDTNESRLAMCDVLFMGGAQDTQQEIVNKDLFEKKGKSLKKLIENDTPGLYICGAYQFLGRYYKTADGKKLPGLDIFPAYTENDGNSRLIGNITIQVNSQSLIDNSKNTLNHKPSTMNYIVGFENHGGRTYLDNNDFAFGNVIKGHGNNGKDKTEGILYKNSIGSYLHGPILPKNPKLADWLIKTALRKKYKTEVDLQDLDDHLANRGRETVLKRLT